jgi:hypothetical protein
VALALAVLALPAPAAPVIKSGPPALKIDKYLLDDTNGVLVIDVKQILSSPAYKKNFQKQLGALIALPQAQEYLKDVGFDPLKDVERVIICLSKSCFNQGSAGADSDDGPFILFQGKFDPVKAKTKMDALARNHPDQVSSTTLPGGQTIYRIDPRHGPYVAQLDGNTLVLAGRKAHVVAALEKVSGKKVTKFAHKEVAEKLRKFKPEVAIQGFALEQMIMHAGVTVKADGMGNQTVETNFTSLADNGFKEATLNINIKDDARGSVVWTVKDKDKVKPLTDMFTKGLDDMRKGVARFVERQPQLAPLARFLEGVTIKSMGQTITMEGKAEASVVEALIMAMGRL